MKRYEVHYFTEVEGDGTHLFDVRFPETPQLGWVLIIKQVLAHRSHANGIGDVVRVVMTEDSDLITVFVKERKM
jgi:hypothetical protein